jgi:uncharacterized protein involved in type VI secretion and phage assembly
MMDGMLNAMRLQAMLAGESRASTRLATVKSYDHANYCAKVMLQPDDIESGWLPVASPWVGNGWGMFAPPSPGDVVVVVYQEGDFNAGIISMRLFSDKARPLDVPSGEFWLVHQSGSALKFKADGSVEIITDADLNATVGGKLNANVTGDMAATVGGKMDATVTGKATITASEVDLVATGGSAKGVVQGDCVCAFTGAPHGMISPRVKGSM